MTRSALVKLKLEWIAEDINVREFGSTEYLTSLRAEIIEKPK
jgi:hypothetical protein